MIYRATDFFQRSVLVLGVVSFLTLAGCLAQQADLKNTSKQLKNQIDTAKADLNNQIQEAKKELDRMVLQKSARLNEDITQLRERELAAVSNALEKRTHEGEKLKQNQDDLQARLDRTSKELREQSNLLMAAKNDLRAEQDKFRADIKAEQERLRSDQERFRSDFRDAVTKDLSKMSGDSAAQVAKLTVRADDLAARLATTENIFKRMGDRLDELHHELKSSDHRTVTLTQRLDAQDKALTDLRQALGDFKQALGGLGEKIVTQDKTASELSGTVAQQTAALAKRVDALGAEMKSITQHVNDVNKTAGGHLEEVNKSVGKVAKALESAGDKFVQRLDEQDQRLEQTAKQIAWLQEVVKRGEDQEQRMEQMGKQIEWLQEVVRRRETPPTETATERPRSAGENGSAKPAPAKLTRPSDSTSNISGSSAKDTVRERYEQLLARMREGDLDHAQEGFTAFLSEHPTSELAPNARFWLGESYYGKKDYRRAIDSYERVERDYPSSEKVPAALLKKGYSFLALRDPRQAAAIFQQLVNRYPKTQEAGKATEKLAQLKRER